MAKASGVPGPSTGLSVDLAGGCVRHVPRADLSVYSPSAAPVVFQRVWNSALAVEMGGSPGLAGGWSHSYDYRLTPAGEPGSWHPLAYRRPDSRVDVLAVELDEGQPTGRLLPPLGAEYLAFGQPGASVGEWAHVTIVDKAQTAWRYEPHESGVYALVSVSNRTGQATLLAWDAARRLQTVVDDSTQTVLLSATYHEGYLAQLEDAYGRKVDYTHELLVGEGYSGECVGLTEVSIVEPIDEDEPRLAYAYGYLEVPSLQSYYYGDKLLLLTEVSIPSPAGEGLSTARVRYYDANYYVAALVDAAGIQQVYAYDVGATVATIFDADNEYVDQWRVTYNSDGLQTSSTCGGCPTSIAYDDPNNPHKPTSIIAPDGRETTYTYDAYGNPLTITDPSGVVLTHTWDYSDFALGRLLKLERTAGEQTVILAEYTYHEPSGLVHTVKTPQPGSTDGSQVTTTTAYDELGNPTSIEAPGNDASPTISTTYDYGPEPKVGQPLVSTDNLGHETHFGYDDRGNRTVLTDALGNTWTFSYNLADQLVEAAQPPTGQQGSGAALVVNGYLYPGGPRTDVTVLDEGGNVVQHINYHFGPEGELITVTGGTETMVQAYDARYRLVELRDGNGNATQFGYDSKGRMNLIRYPLAEGGEGYDTIRFPLHDDAGRVLRRIDGNDVVTDYEWNGPGGALSAIRYPAAPELDVEFAHDALGQVIGMSDATGEHEYERDDLGNLLSVTTTYTDLPARTLSFTYNPDGSRATLTTPGGTQTYGYDAAGRMTSLAYGLGTAEWSWLDNGWLSRRTLPNGAYSEHTYNAAGQLVGLVNRGPDDAVHSSYGEMAYLGTGDLRTVTSAIPDMTSYEGVVAYGYDRKRQLTGEASDRAGGYEFLSEFDPGGNATVFENTAHSYNADNQLTGPGTYEYDGNGNPVTWNGVPLTFDSENRLLAYGNVLTAAYRGDGLRAWKQTASGRRYFLYDGINVVCELDADGDLIAESVFGAAGLVSRGEVHYQFDPLGDAVHLLDADGEVLAHRLFDAWGNEWSTGITDPRGYRALYGYYTDQETGLIALAYRYYAPGVGRFVNRDPIGYQEALHAYRYVSADAVAASDPSGLTAGWDDALFWLALLLVIRFLTVAYFAAKAFKCEPSESAAPEPVKPPNSFRCSQPLPSTLAHDAVWTHYCITCHNECRTVCAGKPCWLDCNPMLARCGRRGSRSHGFY